MPFEFKHLNIEGLILIQPKVFGDERGFFMELIIDTHTHYDDEQFDTDRNELLAAIGYSIRDISGDGVPELLIGTLPDDSPDMESGVVFGGFTCKEQEIVTFLDGWGRNAYQWMGGGEFCNFGSGGAAYAMFGAYQISRDGTELICEDYYFTDIKDENYEEILLYHNTTGVWGRDEAEELSISEEAFWDILKGYEARYQQPDLTPFSAYEYTGYIAQSPDSKVRLDYLEDVAYMLAQYDDASEYLGGFYPPDTEFETTVVFRAEEEIKDFRLLSLSLRDVDDSGHATFDMTEVFRIPVLRPDTPLAVPMSFPGDIPSNGFGYTEADGTLRQFTVGMSGKDGSLEVSPRYGGPTMRCCVCLPYMARKKICPILEKDLQYNAIWGKIPLVKNYKMLDLRKSLPISSGFRRKDYGNDYRRRFPQRQNL